MRQYEFKLYDYFRAIFYYDAVSAYEEADQWYIAIAIRGLVEFTIDLKARKVIRHSVYTTDTKKIAVIAGNLRFIEESIDHYLGKEH